MSLIRATLEGETIAWLGGATWTGYTPRGRRLARQLDTLVPLERSGGHVPSLTLDVARRLEQLAATSGLRLEDLEVDRPEGDADVPDGATP